MNKNPATKINTIPQTNYKFGDKVTVLLPHKSVIMGYTHEVERIYKDKVVKSAIRLIVSIGGQAYTIHPDDIVARKVRKAQS